MLIVIPARGGSKGVPGKNIKLLNGKPLIQYTIEAALQITSKENIIVSTDSPEIKAVVEGLGLPVPFLRPEELATDTAGTYQVLLHALQHYQALGNTADKLVLLQPTSPFRTASHIQKAIALYSDQLDMVVSVKETEANPYYVLKEEDENGYLQPCKKGSFTRRQDCPKVWELNGAIYVINPRSLQAGPMTEFKKIKKYEMDPQSSHDIDTQLDWQLAEQLVMDVKDYETNI